jgi:hypothetical protein
MSADDTPNAERPTKAPARPSSYDRKQDRLTQDEVERIRL